MTRTALGRTAATLGFALAVTLVLSGCFPIRTGGGLQPRPTETPKTFWVASYCEELVGKQLKAPATAQYTSESPVPDRESDPAATLESGPWSTIGTVDSENSFGALLRNRYHCKTTLQLDPDADSDADTSSGTFTTEIAYLGD